MGGQSSPLEGKVIEEILASRRASLASVKKYMASFAVILLSHTDALNVTMRSSKSSLSPRVLLPKCTSGGQLSNSKYLLSVAFWEALSVVSASL